MAVTRFRYSERGEAQLARSTGTAAAMDDAARKVAVEVRRQRAGRTNYAGSSRGGGGRFVAQGAVAGDGGVDADGAYGTVHPDDPGWAIIEYGTADSAAERNFMYGVLASGARWEDNGP